MRRHAVGRFLGAALLWCFGSTASADITTGLVLHYSCDEPNVTGVIRDASPAHNNGRTFGVVQVPQGHIGGACRFQGAGPVYEPGTTIPAGEIDYIRVKNRVHNTKRSLDVGAGNQLTLALWYNVATDAVEESNNQSPLIEWGGETSPSESGIHLWAYAAGGQWGGNGTGANLVDSTGDDSSYIINTADQPRGEWHHLVVTYNRTTGAAKVYLDGQLQNEHNFVITPRTVEDVYIGRRPWDYQRLHGDLDEIRVYRRELSAADVQELYNFVP